MPEIEQFKVKCIRECWDSKTKIHYVPGDEALINPIDPVAKYFKGFPPGTEVYYKTSADRHRTGKIQQGFKKVPEVVAVEPETEKKDLDDLKMQELREIAKHFPEINIAPGVSKKDLVASIKKAQNPEETEAETEETAVS